MEGDFGHMEKSPNKGENCQNKGRENKRKLGKYHVIFAFIKNDQFGSQPISYLGPRIVVVTKYQFQKIQTSSNQNLNFRIFTNAYVVFAKFLKESLMHIKQTKRKYKRNNVELEM